LFKNNNNNQEDEEDEEDLLFDEKDEKNGIRDKKKSSNNANKNAAAGLKNNLRPNVNSLSSFYSNKLNINMNNSNVSDETLNNLRLLNSSANSNMNMNIQLSSSNRNTHLSNKNNNSLKEISAPRNVPRNNKTSDEDKDDNHINDVNINNDIYNKNKINISEKSLLEAIDLKMLEEEVENDCCLEDDDFDGPHIKLNNQDSDMFVSELPRNVNNKKSLLLNNNSNNPKNKSDKNLIKIESEVVVKEKNNTKVVENAAANLDINKIRTAFNLAEKPANVLNKNTNISSNTNTTSQLSFDLNKKSNNVSILNFINKAVKKNDISSNALEFDSRSDLSDNFDIAPLKNKLIINPNGKRKNISGDNDNAKKNAKKRKPNFK